MEILLECLVLWNGWKNNITNKGWLSEEDILCLLSLASCYILRLTNTKYKDIYLKILLLMFFCILFRNFNSRKVSLFSRACWFNMGSTFLLPAFMIVQFSSVLCTSFVGCIHIKNFLYLKDLFLVIGMFNFLASIKHNPKHFSFSTRLKFFHRQMLYIYRFCFSLF